MAFPCRCHSNHTVVDAGDGTGEVGRENRKSLIGAVGLLLAERLLLWFRFSLLATRLPGNNV